MGDKISERAAVSAKDTVESPFLDDGRAKHGILDHRYADPSVVGRHHGVGPAVLDGHAEGPGVVLAEEALVEVRGGTIASVFVAVGEEVLQERGGEPDVRIV